MKNKWIKTITSIAFTLLAFAVIGCKGGGKGGCNKDETGGEKPNNIYDMPVDEKEQTLSLNKSECVLIVGEETELIAQYSLQENATLAWSTTDEGVVTVKDGKLLAMNAGEATVTATYGESSQSCKVTVSFGNMYPSIEFENAVAENITTNTMERVNLFAQTKFNGKVYTDGAFTYTLNGAIGNVSADGTFTPSTTGTGEVVVTMQWRGFTVEKTVSLTVTSLKTILIDDGLVSEIVLYGKGEFQGNTYPTSQELEIEAFEDNQAKEYDVEVLDNNGVVAFDDTTNTVRALQGGTAELKISFETSSGDTFYKILPITVKKHTVQKTIPLFSAIDGVGKGTENLQTLLDGESFIKAESSGASLTITDGYKLTGLTAMGDGMTELKVNAESQSFIYELTLQTYTKVLTMAQDFVDAFNVDGSIAGYYYLANDILPKQGGGYESVKMTKGVSSTKAFKGTFDGAGHTVNLEIGNSNGLFTYLYGATIKNVRFNFQMATNAGGLNAGLAQYTFDKNYLVDVYVNVENLSTNCTHFGAISPYYNGVVHYTRVVVETPTAEELSGYNTAGMGAIARRINYTNASNGTDGVTHGDTVHTDVFIISSMPLAVEGKDGALWTIYAKNQMPDTNGDGSITTDDIDVTNKITYFAQKENIKKGKLCSYASTAELIAKAHDLTSYAESGYWNISTDVPVWKGNS